MTKYSYYNISFNTATMHQINTPLPITRDEIQVFHKSQGKVAQAWNQKKNLGVGAGGELLRKKNKQTKGLAVMG